MQAPLPSPPGNCYGGETELRFDIAKGGSSAVVIENVKAFRTGVQFDIVATGRNLPRVEVEVDGANVTNPNMGIPRGGAKAICSLLVGGSTTGGTRLTFWVSPLPQRSLAFVVNDERIDVDHLLLDEAATRQHCW